MPIDANIALGIKQPQFEDINTIKARGLQLGALQRADSQAQQDQAEQTTIRDLYRRATGADGKIDVNVLSRSVAEAGLGDRVPGIQKQALEAERARTDADKAGTDRDAANLKLTKDKIDGMNGILAGVLSNPDAGAEEVTAGINEAVNRGYMTPEQGAQTVRGIGPNPRQWAMQRAVEGLDHAKQIDLLLPKHDEQDRGDVINEGTINPLTGVRTAGADVKKGVAPGVALTNQRLTDAQSGSAFTPEEGSLMAALAERGISLPAGMRSRAQMKSTFASLLSRNPGSSPDDIAEKIATGQINMGAERKETTTAATQAGRVAVAVNELNTFGDLVEKASNAIPRGQFIPINKLIQMTDAQLSDPALINLKVQMQSLNNAYDTLAARGGTDAEKRAHIAQLFNTAASPEGVSALVAAVKAEAKAAEEAARKATQRRPHESTQAPGPGTGASDVPDDIAALLAKHGSK